MGTTRLSSQNSPGSGLKLDKGCNFMKDPMTWETLLRSMCDTYQEKEHTEMWSDSNTPEKQVYE